MKKIVFGLFFIFFFLAKNSVYAAPPGASSDWEVTYNDEFDGSTLNLAKWGKRYQYGEIVINNEKQAYTDDAFDFPPGILRIKGEKRQVWYGGGLKNYTSGLINSADKFNQQYGYFEIRCKLPKGVGFWPAFWLSPQTFLTTEIWEIDIFEFINDNLKQVYLANHWGTDYGSGSYKSSTTYLGPDDFTADFHIFAVDWQPTYIRWYIDGRLRKEYTVADNIPDVPMVVQANFAIGGGWPGDPDATTVFPGFYDIDYIRVYRKANNKVNNPMIFPQRRIFAGSTVITLSTSTVGADIYYTTDGSDPTSLSTLYTQPFTISADTNLKVIALKTGMIDSSVVSTNFSIYPVNYQLLPSSWREVEIGNAAGPGITKYYPSIGTYLISGDGYGVNRSDSLHFVYQPLFGDGEIKARIVNFDQTQTNYHAKVGLMVRKDLAFPAISRDVYIFASSMGDGGAAYRYVDGGTPEIRFPISSVALPIWFKLVRNSDSVMSYTSKDGVFWNLIGIDNLPTGDAFMGIFVNSGYNGVFTTLVIDNLSVIGTIPFPSCPLIASGDIDCSGQVNAIDLSKLILKFGQTYSGREDVDGSGQVNAIDLAILLSNFGK
jgi:beta-glucanase (GH16 family)